MCKIFMIHFIYLLATSDFFHRSVASMVVCMGVLHILLSFHLETNFYNDLRENFRDFGFNI